MTSTLSQTSYRRDIDGLRAIAVLAVVLFHADAIGMQGGFVGVDIFFVISGYLITSIIAGDLAEQKFSVVEFYERRIRRIVPALVAVMAMTTLVSVVILPPQQLASFGRSEAAASAFFANIAFARHTGYFAGTEAAMPLLHTWSLGVEEQFYIIWPLILAACYRAGLELGLKALVVLLGLASLVFSEWSVAGDHSERTFYLLQSRVWELMLGAVLALGMLPRITVRWLREILCLVGLGLMAYSIIAFSPATPFPGLYAAMPCVGAVLVIHAGREGDTAVSSFLSLRPCVLLGLISYSLYLWHWPIFAFLEFLLSRPPSASESAAAVAVSIVIAAASWRYIEQPFRHRDATAAISRRTCFVGGLGALSLTGCIGVLLFISRGLPARIDAETLRFALASQEINPQQSECHTDTAEPRPALPCVKPAPKSPGGKYDIIVWGDSHADSLFPAIAALAENYGVSARQATKSGCPPLEGVEKAADRHEASSKRNCADFNRAVMRMLQEGPRPSLAILAGRWSLYTETVEAIGGKKHSFLIDEQDQTLDVTTSRRVFARSLARTVDALNALGIPVLLPGQAPEFEHDPNTCFVGRRMYGGNTGACFSLGRQTVEERLRASNEILREIAGPRPRVERIDLAAILCDARLCWAKRDGPPLYADDDHLNLYGARLVASALMNMPELSSLLVPDATKTAARARTSHLTNWSPGAEP